jgi:GTP-binding protein EngB required for normal cell division
VVSRESILAANAQLNESQQRHLVVSCQYIDRLIADIEQIVLASSSGSLFPRYTATLTAIQKKVLGDYLARIRDRLLTVLASQHLQPPSPRGGDVFAIRTTLTFIQVAIEELKPKYMRGYGDVPETLVPQLDGIADELATIVQKLEEYLAEDPARDLQARLARLEHGRDDVQSLTQLERIITARGLVQFRPTLTMLVERASSQTFEIAVFGRVSSGKSSLLNHVLEAPVLPVGITPITAVPTRIAYGREPTLHVRFADRPGATLPLERLPEFVTEQHNPGNARHVSQIVVEVPARRLREGVVFVDTPGLGSLARGGAEQTMAYLPRCDLGAVLIDAGSTLTPDDLLTVQALYEAAVPATVLLSKADLLGNDERGRAAAYIAEQLRKELNVQAAVHPVSVMPSHTALLEHWFSTVIEPLCERHQEAARLSIQRKIAALREAVQASLRVRVDRYGRSSIVDAAALQEAEQELRRTAGLFAPAVRRCEDRAESLGSLGREVLNQAAARLRREGPAVRQDPALGADAVEASLRDVVGDLVDSIRSEIGGVASASVQAIEQAAHALRLGADRPCAQIDHLPQLAFSVGRIVVARASWLAVSRKLQLRYLEHQLRQQLAERLDESLAAYAKLISAWSRTAIEATRAAFEQQAEPLRAEFERLRRPGSDRADADETPSLTRDLAELEEQGAGHAPQR